MMFIIHSVTRSLVVEVLRRHVDCDTDRQGSSVICHSQPGVKSAHRPTVSFLRPDKTTYIIILTFNATLLSFKNKMN